MELWRGYAAVGLHEPKYGGNIGAAMRACHCYGAAFVALSGQRFRKERPDVTCAWRHIPVIETEDLFDALPVNCTTIAVEFLRDARPLTTFQHPERAFYMFGGEDRTLGDEILNRCDHVVFIPTLICMNLGATVNVTLYDRLLKRGRTARAA